MQPEPFDKLRTAPVEGPTLRASTGSAHIAAVVNTFAIVAVLLLMAANAIRIGLRTGRWW